MIPRKRMTPVHRAMDSPLEKLILNPRPWCWSSLHRLWNINNTTDGLRVRVILRMMMVQKMLGTNNPPPSLTSQYHKSSRTKKFILMKNKIRQSYTTLHYQGVALHYTLVRTITSTQLSISPSHFLSVQLYTRYTLYTLNTAYTLHTIHCSLKTLLTPDTYILY